MLQNVLLGCTNCVLNMNLRIRAWIVRVTVKSQSSSLRLFRRQRQQPVRSATLLERASQLQVFQLEKTLLPVIRLMVSERGNGDR
jgi:hypothetical protein